MAAGRGIGVDAGGAFMLSAALMYGVVAAACSSPQTAEINADKRSKTLMKWVGLGLVQGAALVGIAASISPEPKAVIAGGSIAGGLMLISYLHANSAGLKSSAPGTEQYR